MKILFLSIFVGISLLIPSSSYAQEWKSAVEHINQNRVAISGISYRHPGDVDGEHVDSLFIQKNENYEEMVIELYNTLIEPNDPVEYVTAMDLPIQNLMEVSNFEGELVLSFNRNCKQKDGEDSEKLILYTTSEKENYVMHAAFKHLSNVSREYHRLRHDRDVCELGKLQP